MSKSIYEEALEKINVEFDAWDRAEHLELFELVEQALKQAQKQEKLFEQLYNVCKEYKYTSIGLSDDSEFLNVMSELEEELK